MNTINKYLDNETVVVLKSSVDFLEKHGTTITSIFYKKLFSAHPELKNVFNLAHQSSGDQSQALAQAIYGFASHLDDLDQLAEQISRIGHKHTSLQVQVEHYPIVGKYLLEAIHEVVSDIIDATTADTITVAWEKAYGVLANLLIDFEQKLYDQAEQQFAGWKGLRKFTLLKREDESAEITSFYIQPSDNKALPVYHAGQYISLYVKADDWEYQQIRQYSLSDAHRDDCYRISIKKDGLVSRYLHEHWQVGDSIQITPPAGDFYLQDRTQTPIVLLGAGVGVTPMISVLKSVLEKRQQQKIIFAHAVKNSEDHAFKQFIQQISQNHPDRLQKTIFYEAPLDNDQLGDDYDYQGLMDLNCIPSVVDQESADYYLCGPKPFMTSIYKTLSAWGVKKQYIHYEVFGSDKTL